MKTSTKVLLAVSCIITALVIWLGSTRYTFIVSGRVLYRCDRWTGKVSRSIAGEFEWKQIAEQFVPPGPNEFDIFDQAATNGPWNDYATNRGYVILEPEVKTNRETFTFEQAQGNP